MIFDLKKLKKFLENKMADDSKWSDNSKSFDHLHKGVSLDTNHGFKINFVLL